MSSPVSNNNNNNNSKEREREKRERGPHGNGHWRWIPWQHPPVKLGDYTHTVCVCVSSEGRKKIEKQMRNGKKNSTRTSARGSGPTRNERTGSQSGPPVLVCVCVCVCCKRSGRGQRFHSLVSSFVFRSCVRVCVNVSVLIFQRYWLAKEVGGAEEGGGGRGRGCSFFKVASRWRRMTHSHMCHRPTAASHLSKHAAESRKLKTKKN